MTQFMRPFCPKIGGTLTIANAVAATAPQSLGNSDAEVVLYNASAVALAFVRIVTVPANTDTPSAAFGNATLADFPVPPLAQIRLSPGVGFKWISVIALAADGNIYATPGHGN